jgi:FHS family L-fucose permease-like MFS transporter
MAHIGSAADFEITSNQQNQRYAFPLTAMTTLFFLWGFITVLNDVLIPHLRNVFSLSFAQAMMVQFCFFGAYFLVSVPAGWLVRIIGYKKGVITGLCVSATGCLLFYPAVNVLEYWFFLFALFVLASGLTILQVSANPYVAVLGSPETASSRLNLAQALNSLGTTIAPWFGGMLIFSSSASLITAAQQAEAVKVPYLILAGALMTIAIVFAIIKLPEIHGGDVSSEKTKVHPEEKLSIFSALHLRYGLVAIFFYVGAEVSVGSFIVNYFNEPYMGALKEAHASSLLAFYWGGAMVGRFLGFAVMRVISPYKVVIFNAVIIMLLLLLTVNTEGSAARWAVLAIGLFNSIMFPTIFTMGIDRLGTRTSQGSGLLCLGIVGGAIVPLIQGVFADAWNIQVSFLVPAVCYFFIIWYAFNCRRFVAGWDANVNSIIDHKAG